MKPGNTHETPTPAGAQVLRAARARSRAARTSSPSTATSCGPADLPESDETNTRCPDPRAASGSASSRASWIGARRFTASARSISSGVNEVELAAGRQRRVGDEHVDVARLREQPGRRVRLDEVGRDRAAAELGRERLQRLGPPPRQDHAARRARASARAAAPPIAAGRAGQAATVRPAAASREHGDRRGEAVHEVLAADRPDLAGGEEPRRRARRRARRSSARGVVMGVRRTCPRPRPLQEISSAPAGTRPPSASMRAPSASRRSRSALAASRACRRTTWPGRTSVPTATWPVSGIGADQAADEEVALHVVGLVRVDHDAHQQPALDEPRGPRR